MIDHLAKLAVHAYYCGELDVGRRACDRALRMDAIPADLEQQVRSNRVWYSQPLADLVGATTFRRIDIPPAHEGWSLFNPSMIAHGGRTLAVVRSSNYTIRDGRYVMPPEDGERIRTENILCRITDNLCVEGPRVIVAEGYQTNGYPVEGIEDARLLVGPRGLAVSGTIRDAAGFDGRCRIGLADLDVENAAIGRPLMIDGLQCSTHEKNWMPIEGLPSTWLHACSSDGHTTTVDPDPTMPGGWRVCRRGKAPPVARGFRGGSQLVAIDDRGWLAVIHEVAAFGNHRAYEHRFIAFDRDLCVSAVSPPFAIREARTIEFAAGMVRMGDDVVISFGVRDAEAWLCRVPIAEVLGCLVSAW